MFNERSMIFRCFGIFFLLLFIFLTLATGADQPQWGEKFTRNMISNETSLPVTFNVQTGENIKWTVPLGTDNYATPAIADGKVFIGANNQRPRDPRLTGDCGVLLCLNEEDGSLIWQLVVPRRNTGDVYLDWPRIALPSTPTIENEHVYTLTNHFEVVCLDINGMANGNDGPYTDEASHMTPQGRPAIESSQTDADIIWLFDMPEQAGTYPHDAANSSILIDGPFLYINSCNGVDNTHKVIRRPDAPSLIVLDKETGRLIAKDDEHIGPKVFHSTWSSPSLGWVNGRKMIFFAGGDGTVYAFEALTPEALQSDKVQSLKCIWKHTCDPRPEDEIVHGDYGNTQNGPSTILGMPVFHENKIYVAFGGDVMQARRTKNLSWLKCIDATKSGDITESGAIWTYKLEGQCCSTPAIYDGMVFIADCGGIIHCLDKDTGSVYWEHDTNEEIWGSTLIADGRIYVGTRRGNLYILEAAREKNLISSITIRTLMTSTPVAANGVLYVSTMQNLYAIENTN